MYLLLRKLFRALAAVVVFAVVLVSNSPKASAGVTYKMPFKSNETWEVEQGVHSGTAFDLDRIGEGTPEVLAVAAGVARTDNCTPDNIGQATVILTDAGGKTFRYVHLDAASVSTAGITSKGVQVSQGAVLGRLFSGTNWSSGCGSGSGSHLHLVMPYLPIVIDGVTFSSSGPARGTRLASTSVKASSTVEEDTGQTGVMPGNDWFLSNYLDSRNAQTVRGFGTAGSVALVGDWDGDGDSTPGVFRDGKWYLTNSRTSSTAEIVFGYGNAGNTPLVGNWDGVGGDTIGVRSGNVFYLSNYLDSRNAQIVFGYGTSASVPIAGNWDGVGGDTIGVRYGDTFYLSNYLDSRNAQIVFGYGNSGNTPLVGNWDGKGGDTIGIRSDNDFFLSNYLDSRNAQIVFGYGGATDVPVVGNWDGVGGDTIGVVG